MHKSYLNDLENAALQSLADNQIAMMALEKFLLEDIYNRGVLKPGEEANPTVNYTLALASKMKRLDTGNDVSFEKIGQDLVATWEGINLVARKITELKNMKVVVPEKESTENEAV